MAGQEGLEPPAAGFGVRSSTIRATGLCPTPHRQACISRLSFCFLMNCVFTTESAVLIQIQLVRRIPFILGR
jgi:hypothetical protein